MPHDSASGSGEAKAIHIARKEVKRPVFAENIMACGGNSNDPTKKKKNPLEEIQE